jgi:hypothetical protein
MPLCEAVLYEEHTTSRKPLPEHCKMGFRNANMMLVFKDGGCCASQYPAHGSVENL